MNETTSSEVQRRVYFEQNTCRLCSCTRDKVLPIFDTSGSKFDEKIRQCLPSIQVCPTDGKPQQICLECITKLNINYEFLLLCLKSDCFFDSFIRTCKLKTKSEEDFNNEIRSLISSASENHQPTDGLIVLSKLDQPSETVQDLVMVVELKYKDGSQPLESEGNNLSEPNEFEPIRNWAAVKTFLNDSVEQEFTRTRDELPREDTSNVALFTAPNEHISSSFRFDPEKKEYSCGICDKIFRKRSRLLGHLANHNNEKPYSCDDCGKSFALKCDLNIHCRVHRRDIVCSTCDKAFPTKTKLTRHMRVHTGEKPFTCSHCNKCFSDKRNLDNHLRIHTGQKPYPCSICGKLFAVRSHMVEHMNVHKKSSSFSCTLCHKSFRWRPNYRKHMKMHSPTRNEKLIQN